MYHDKLKTFEGKPVVDFDPKSEHGSLEIGTKIYRILTDWDELPSAEDSLQAYLSHPGVEATEQLVIGNHVHGDGYGDTTEGIVQILKEQKEKLPKLKAAFFGDTEYVEAMISTLYHGDFTSFVQAFPALEYLHIRGSNGLKFSPFRHISLRKLVLETGGLDKTVLHALSECVLPELTHLELWLGEEDYGWNGTIEDLQPYLQKGLFLKLNYLGLKNCGTAGAVAKAVAQASVLEQIEELDLSGGVLNDAEAQPLIDSAGISQLKRLNLHRNFLSDSMAQAFRKLSPVEVDVSGQEEDEDDGDYRYVASGE